MEGFFSINTRLALGPGFQILKFENKKFVWHSRTFELLSAGMKKERTKKFVDWRRDGQKPEKRWDHKIQIKNTFLIIKMKTLEPCTEVNKFTRFFLKVSFQENFKEKSAWKLNVFLNFETPLTFFFAKVLRLKVKKLTWNSWFWMKNWIFFSSISNLRIKLDFLNVFRKFQVFYSKINFTLRIASFGFLVLNLPCLEKLGCFWWTKQFWNIDWNCRKI